MTRITRRNFCRQGCGLALGAGLPSFLEPTESEKGIWVTSKERKWERFAPPQWHSSSVDSENTIFVDLDRKYQTILGFGAAFTDSSCYLINRLSSDQRSKILNELFGADGLRLSVCRTCVGASDYSRNLYSYDDSSQPDTELTKFSIDHDKNYILPTLRAAKSINPDMFLFSSPWSPPGWMKTGNSLLGGSMRKKYFAAYAQYFVRFLREYQNEGVQIDAITSQNEPDTDQDGRMPATVWGQEYEIEFVKNHLGPALKSSELRTNIWILDHNYNLWGRVIDELSDPEMHKYVDGIAWHNYGGDPNAITRVHEAFPDVPSYWTEGGPDITDPEYLTNWGKWSCTFTDVLSNWSRCIVGWNLALDELGHPKIGPFSCGGLITIDSKSQAVSRSGQYWAFAHYSKVMQRGCHIVASICNMRDLAHLAFVNPNGTTGLIITNIGTERKVTCRRRGNMAELVLYPDSITTVLW